MRRQDDQQAKILFVCNDSFRSQMARGWALQLKRDEFKPFAMGLSQQDLDIFAIQAMQEAELPMMDSKSINFRNLDQYHFDYVVILCTRVLDKLSDLSRMGKVVQVFFDDPVAFSIGLPNEDAFAINRRVRDEIRDFVKEMPDNLESLCRIDPP